MTHIIGQLIFGFVVGVIAKFLMPGKDPGGCIITALLGIAGSAFFSWIVRSFFNGAGITWQWTGAVVGTILLLIIYRMIFGGKS